MRLGYAPGAFTMEDLQCSSNRFLPSSKHCFSCSCSTLVMSAGQGLVFFHRIWRLGSLNPTFSSTRSSHKTPPVRQSLYAVTSHEVSRNTLPIQHGPHSWSLSILWVSPGLHSTTLGSKSMTDDHVSAWQMGFGDSLEKGGEASFPGSCKCFLCYLLPGPQSHVLS